jgi:hypothetical protein
VCQSLTVLLRAQDESKNDKAVFDTDLDEGSEIHVLGKNEKGQLGIGKDKEIAEPYAICKNYFDPPPGSLEDAARRGLGKCESLLHCGAGPNFAFFYNLEEDIMYGCGANAYGQLGAGMTSPIYSMIPCRLGPCSQRSIRKISCGSAFTWFITDKDEVLAAGSNGYGEHSGHKPPCVEHYY